MSAAPTHPAPTGITIDGSQHEGGGQIVRNAVALAAVAGVPIRVTAIRAGRPKPGLRPQHVAGVRLVAALSARSALAGCEVGSTELDFVPGRLALRPAQAADAGTAGSTMLMAQTALPALALAGRPAAGAAAAADAAPGGGRGGGEGVDPGASVLLTLQGGTDAAMAPPADYAAEVLLPTLARAAGLRVCMAVTRRGFYPRGGGRVELTVTPLRPGATLPPLVLQRAGLGDVLTSVTILTSCAGRVTPAAVAAGAAALEAELRSRWAAAAAGPGAPPPPTPTITTRPSRSHAAPASGDGGSLTAIGCTVSGLLFGASAPLTPRDDPAAVGARLAGELADDVACPDASVDRWMGDQLVVWAALAGGGGDGSGASRWTTSAPPTPHARAAAAVATAITGCVCRSHPPTQPGEGWGMEIHGAGVRAGGGGG